MRIITVIPHYVLDRILKIVNLKNLFNSQATSIEIMNSIVFNRYITCTNYTMSNYGVWMMNNNNDVLLLLLLLLVAIICGVFEMLLAWRRTLYTNFQPK